MFIVNFSDPMTFAFSKLHQHGIYSILLFQFKMQSTLFHITRNQPTSTKYLQAVKATYRDTLQKCPVFGDGEQTMSRWGEAAESSELDLIQ